MSNGQSDSFYFMTKDTPGAWGDGGGGVSDGSGRLGQSCCGDAASGLVGTADSVAGSP